MSRNLPTRRWPFDGRDDLMRLFPERLLRLFPDLEEEDIASGWKPAVDVKEKDKEYVVTADIPGVDPKDIDVTMENGVLTVKGERKSETRDERNGYRRVERFEGTFFRRIALPEAGEPDRIVAHSRNGVLEITVPRKTVTASKRIPISS